MKKTIVTVLLIFAISGIKAQTFNAALATMLQDTLNTYVSQISNIKGMSAGVTIPGQGSWYGVTGVSYTGQPITPAMKMGIASNSKLFVSVMMLKLAERGIISLDDSVKKWLPTYTNVNPNIKIRQLLNHTSGVSDPIFVAPWMDTIRLNPTRVFPPTEVLSWLGAPLFPVGTSYGYSNVNYILAGMIAKNATGFHISKLIRDSILAPLNMDSTFYDVEETATGTIAHRWWNTVDYHDTSRVSLNTAGGCAGAIFSTSSEMMQWYQALFNGQILSQSSMNQLTGFVNTGAGSTTYGLGLSRDVTQGYPYWGHGGTTWGYRSKMIHDSCLKVTVCGLTNSYPSGMESVTFLLYRVVKNHVPSCVGSISGLTTVCAGTNSVTYTTPAIGNATSYSWTLPTGATGTSTTNSITVNFGTNAVSGNITVRGVNTYGLSPAATLAITVNPLPAAGTITGTTTVCQGQNTVVYRVSPISNATSYIWTLPTGATGTSTKDSIVVSFGVSATSGNITVKGNNNCGNGTVSTLAITVNPLPLAAGTIAGTTTVCQGQNTAIYAVPAIANATSYAWTLPSGAIGSSTKDSITVNYSAAASSGNIIVKGTNACGDGATSSLAVTVNPLPLAAGTIAGTTTVCQGQNTVIYSVPAITNATSYTWTLPSGANGSSTKDSITVNYSAAASSGNIVVKGTNACGDGATSSLAITVNPLPLGAGTIAGTTTVCQGQNTVIYAVPTITNATSYAWTLPTGATGSSTKDSITVNYNAAASSGNIVVKGTNACGDGATSSLAITVNPLPASAGTITGNVTVCRGQNAVVYSVPSIADAGLYIWTLPSGATGTSTTNSITVSYSKSATSGQISVKGNNNCGNGLASTFPVQVTVVPTGITLSGTTLTADSVATSYQWVNCTSGYSPITGATGKQFTPVTSGNYAVILTSNSCTDTSICQNIIINGVFQLNTEGVLLAYPNPVHRTLVLDLPYSGFNVVVYDGLGKVVKELVTTGGKQEIDMTALPTGMYFIQASNNNKLLKAKIIKQ